MNEYYIYVYVDGWAQRPFSRKFLANTKEDAIEQCKSSLKEDEHFKLKADGSIWFRD